MANSSNNLLPTLKTLHNKATLYFIKYNEKKDFELN